MSIQAMKGEAVKGMTAAVISLLAGFLGYLLAGNFVASALEFKMGTKEAYFAIPEQMKNGLNLQLQGKPIENVSVVDVGLFNRGRDISDAKVYFKLTSKKDKLPQLISAEIVPPDNVPKIGVERLQKDDPSLIGFRFSTLKRQSSDEYYLARLIFEGNEAPLVKVQTNDKDVEIVPYREWRDWLFVGGFILAVYTLIIVVLIWWDSKRSVKRREQLAKDFEALLMQENIFKTQQDDQPYLLVTTAVTTYKKFIEPKPGFFSKKKSSAIS